MRAVRSINNNIAVCVDSAGNELIAMGKGIGYGKLPREIALEDVTQTFYNVSPKVLAGIEGIPEDVMVFSANLAERARDELSYQLSPNLAFTLADHIAFALKRARDGVYVSMPLAFDVEQSYPDEYRIARQAVRRLRRDFRVNLRDAEATGIALNIVNARADFATEAELASAQRDEDMLEDITEIVERDFSITVSRSSFAYSRYATHMNYLFGRLHADKSLDGANLELYADVRADYPQVDTCVEKICGHLREEWGCEVTDEERLYIFIHVNRLRVKEES